MKSSDVSTQPGVTAETYEIKRDHCLRWGGAGSNREGNKQIKRVNVGPIRNAKEDKYKGKKKRLK